MTYNTPTFNAMCMPTLPHLTRDISISSVEQMIRILTLCDGSVCNIVVKELPPLHDEKCEIVVDTVAVKNYL